MESRLGHIQLGRFNLGTSESTNTNVISIEIFDNLNNWNDYGTSEHLFLEPNDDLNILSDSISVGRIRLSQQVLETLVLPTTAKIRLSQQVLEVLISSLILDITASDSIDFFSDEISIDFGLQPSDSINNLDDAASLILTFCGTQVSDNLNSNIAWRDEVNNFSLSISKSVEDYFGKSKGQSGKTGDPYLRDAVSIQYYATNAIVVTDDINDLIDASDADLSEPPVLVLDIIITDLGIILTDTHLENIGIPLTFSDLLEFLDQLNLFPDLPIITADSIFNLSDTISLVYKLIKLVSDRLTLSDAAKLRLDYLLTKNDSLSISDVISIRLGHLSSFDDSINNWDDVTSNDLFIILLIAVSDLLSLSDAISIKQAIDLITYIRRYLNDVNYYGPIPIMIKVGKGINNQELVTYLRRYLNDVTSTTSGPGDSMSSNDEVSVQLS